MAGIPAEDFCLKWNDHHSIFFSSVERLCELDTLTDVTISCGTRDFTAHKLVLSVCSGYFARLFGGKRTMGVPDIRSAIVYLKDVNPRHMELLLNYMYRGEINVQESELVGLLETARSLQIKGLADNAEPSGGTTPNDTSVPAKKPPKSKVGLPTMSQLPKLTQKRPMTTNSDVINTETSPTTKKIKEESSWSTGTANSSADPESPIEEITNHDEGNTNEDYLAEEEYAYEEEYAGMDPESNDNSNFGSNSGDGQNLGAIQPAIPLGGVAGGHIPAECPQCGKVISRASDLRRHLKIHSGIKPFGCHLCDYRSNRKYLIRRHQVIVHKYDEDEDVDDLIRTNS